MKWDVIWKPIISGDSVYITSITITVPILQNKCVGWCRIETLILYFLPRNNKELTLLAYSKQFQHFFFSVFMCIRDDFWPLLQRILYGNILLCWKGSAVVCYLLVLVLPGAHLQKGRRTQGAIWSLQQISRMLILQTLEPLQMKVLIILCSSVSIAFTCSCFPQSANDAFCEADWGELLPNTESSWRSANSENSSYYYKIILSVSMLAQQRYLSETMVHWMIKSLVCSGKNIEIMLDGS